MFEMGIGLLFPVLSLISLIIFIMVLIKQFKQGGALLLSGILWEYNFDVRAMLERCGCEIVTNRMLEQYSTVLARR